MACSGVPNHAEEGLRPLGPEERPGCALPEGRYQERRHRLPDD